MRAQCLPVLEAGRPRARCTGGASSGLSLACGRIFSLCPHVVIPLCICTQISPSYMAPRQGHTFQGDLVLIYESATTLFPNKVLGVRTPTGFGGVDTIQLVTASGIPQMT